MISRLSANFRICLLLLLVAFPLAGCASGGMEGPAAGQGNTFLRVQNDLVPSVSVRVYAVATSGGRTLVGAVSPGATTTLRFTPVGGMGEYHFVAEVMLGRQIVSNPLNFTAGETIEWDLTTNFANVASSS